MMQWKRKDLDLGRNQHDMMCERVNDVRGCRDDGMLEEGVEMWPILQYKNHYKSILTPHPTMFSRRKRTRFCICAPKREIGFNASRTQIRPRG